MDDAFGPTQRRMRLRTKKPMCVGDKPNLERGSQFSVLNFWFLLINWFISA
jgi:hypothetical protein